MSLQQVVIYQDFLKNPQLFKIFASIFRRILRKKMLLKFKACLTEKEKKVIILTHEVVELSKQGKQASSSHKLRKFKTTDIISKNVEKS